MHRRCFVLAAAGLALPLPLAAHHGWGSYDAANPVTFNGTIEKVEFVNPHVHIEMKVSGEAWEMTFAPPFRMNNRGASEQIVAVGKPIRVHGYKNKAKKNELRAEWIELAGKRYELR